MFEIKKVENVEATKGNGWLYASWVCTALGWVCLAGACACVGC